MPAWPGRRWNWRPGLERNSQASTLGAGGTHLGTLQQEPLKGRPVTMAKTLKRKSRTKGVTERGDTGADHPGGATMATASKFQSPGDRTRRTEDPQRGSTGPLGLRNARVPPPHLHSRLLAPTSGGQSSPVWPGLPRGQILPVCNVPCRREVSSPTHGEGWGTPKISECLQEG